jgi:hypothetical protein
MFKKIGLVALLGTAILKLGVSLTAWIATQSLAALGLFIGVIAYEAGFFFLLFRLKKNSGRAKRFCTLLRI